MEADEQNNPVSKSQDKPKGPVGHILDGNEGLNADEPEAEEEGLEGELEEGEGLKGPQEGKKKMTKEQQQQMKMLRQMVNKMQQRYAETIRGAKEGDVNKFEMTQLLGMIQQFVKMWTGRPIKTQKMMLDLHIPFPSYEQSEEEIKEFFQQLCDQYPSIRLFINETRLESKGTFRVIGEDYFEGTEENMMVFTDSKETVYHGQVKENTIHGNGNMQCHSKTDGFEYTGGFEHGKFSGMGVLKKGNFVYEGEFKDDYRHGKGSEFTWKKRKKPKPGQKQDIIKKSIYTGEYQYGMKCGEGREETSHGVYQGEWKEDVKWGKGTMMYKNGDHYEGEWANNEFSGEGKYTEQENCVYEGEFKEGKYHGKGVMDYCNGDKYEGEYQKGLKHGEGNYSWADGDYYDGEWVRDSADGKGTSMLGTDFYDGEFKNGLKHGEGELTNEDGDMVRALWEEGEKKRVLEINGEPVDEDEELEV